MSANVKGFGVQPVAEGGVPESGWNVWLNQIARAVNQLLRGQVQPIGTVLADDPPAGFVGEYVSNSATAVSMTTNVTGNITSISLSPGDWDVWGAAQFGTQAGAVMTFCEAGTNTTSATLPSAGDGSLAGLTITFPANSNQAFDVGAKRYNVASTTTVYLVGQCTFTGGTATTSGFLAARRVR